MVYSDIINTLYLFSIIFYLKHTTSSPLPSLLGGKLMRMSEDDFMKLVTQGIMYYEREERDLNMLLYPEILEHITNIDRVLTSYSGHILLVGKP